MDITLGQRRPLPHALPHPGSNRRGTNRSLSYSYVNESWGQVNMATGENTLVTVNLYSQEKGTPGNEQNS